MANLDPLDAEERSRAATVGRLLIGVVPFVLTLLTAVLLVVLAVWWIADSVGDDIRDD